MAEFALCIRQNFTLLRDELPGIGDGRLIDLMHLFLNEDNLADIESCAGPRRKIAKLLKILLNQEEQCFQLVQVIGEERGDLKNQMDLRSEYLKERGIPSLNGGLDGLGIARLQIHEKFLEEELEPVYICDLLFEESAVNMFYHNEVTETKRRKAQVKCLLKAVMENEHDCFHFFLYMLQKENCIGIIEELKKPEIDAVGNDDVQRERIVLTLSVGNSDIETALYQLFYSHWSEIQEEAISHGQMIIEDISLGSVILQLRPLAEEAAHTLLDAKNNRLLEMIFGMLKRMNISKIMEDSNQMEIHVQISYARPRKAMQDRTEAVLESNNTTDLHSKADEIRKLIASNYKNILDEMQITLAKEALSDCIGDIDTVKENILPKYGKRRQRMNKFLEFILHEDNNVIEFERMLQNNGMNELLNINENEKGEHLAQVRELRIFEEPRDLSPSDEIMFESAITISFTADNDVYDGSAYDTLSREKLEEADIPTRSPAEKSKKNKVLEKLKGNLKALDKPKNILLLGEFGAGKSSFINSAIMALTGEYDYHANVGSGERNVTTSLCRIGCDEYWSSDDDLKLPTFVDIIGLDPQLSDDTKEDTVNSMIMNLIINGNLPDNCDLLDLSKKLKDGRRIAERSEEKTLPVDAIVVVISAETSNLPHKLMYEIYKESNMKIKKIPVFGVLTKLDRCALSENEIEDKKIEVCNALGIIPEKLLICSNYQPKDEPDEVKDISILEFLNTVCNPRLKAVTLQKVECEPPTPVPPVNPPTASNDTSLKKKALLGACVICLVGFLLTQIMELLSKQITQNTAQGHNST